MSVAPDLAPDVHIPARALPSSRRARAVEGNVIIVTAFVGADRPDATAPTDPSGRRLRVVPADHAIGSERDRTQGDRVLPGHHLTSTARDSATGLRMTALGRMVLAAASVAAALAVVVGAWFGAGSTSAAPTTPIAAQVVVQSGDTLWTIAGRVAPAADPRRTVQQLMQINDLRSVDLVAGQVLRTR